MQRRQGRMQRVPIRLGSLRTSVTASSATAALSVHGDEQLVANASLARVCRVCTTREARYTCPRCNAPYCSAACYGAHGQRCTEQFFESHVRSEMQMTADHGGDGERGDRQQQRSMNALLERVRQFQDEQQRQTETEGDDDDALAARMQQLAVLDASGELTMETLTSEERKRFLAEVADGRLGKLVALWSPWWLLSERKYCNETSARRREVILEEISSSSEATGEVETPPTTLEPAVAFPVGLFTTREAKAMPESLATLLPNGKPPSPKLRFHLVELLFAYALVLRTFNGDYAQDVADAALLLLARSRVLSADARYESLEHACLVCLEAQTPEDVAANRLALQDAQRLLESRVFLLDALSDMQMLVTQYQHELPGHKKQRKQASKQLAAVLKKLQFFQTWAFLTSSETFRTLAAELAALARPQESS
ncbi:hypothetical protein BBJ28_00015845 [Nothophytophthora sp. Chile5]|nr:hypothetical protein BBJ28_00015845 [Nothophytophthora sp. Chile5]